MGAFSPTGPTPGPPDVPTIPVPNYTTQAQQEAAGYAAAGWFDQFWAKHTAHILPGVVAVIQFFVSIIDSVVAGLLEIYSGIQGGHSPGTFTLAAAAVSDLLGVQVDSTTIQAAYAKGGNAAITALGGAVFGQLASELKPAGSTIQPQDGFNAAQTFLGFGLQFAVREGNLEFITSLIPEEWRVGEGLRGYGTGMAKSLGLGRLTRLALQPIFKIFIQDPITWYYNQIYTPTLLGASSAIKAYNRALIDTATFNSEMAYAGYTPDRVAALQAEQLTQLTPADLYTQLKNGLYDENTISTALQALGWFPNSSTQWLQIQTWNDFETAADAVLSAAFTRAQSDPNQAAGFNAMVDSYAIGTGKQAGWKERFAQQFAHPRKFLTWADIESAYVKGIIAIDDAQQWLIDEGYSTNNQFILMALLTAKLDTDESKAASAKYTYQLAVSKAQAQGIAPPPPPAGITVGS